MSQEKPKIVIPRKVRLYIYSVMIAACAVLVFYGFFTIDEGGLWISVIATLLAVPGGIAIDNVPKQTDQ